jgi:DNA repair protein RecN (Recombination protein N)
MLLNLHVKNIALIDDIEVDFRNNLNILTGETGAGKSVIIGSVNGALGGKISKDMLRNPEQDALVELLFQMQDDTVDKILEKEGIGLMNDHQVILSRKITAGRSVSRINGEMVTAAKIKEVATHFIDIHGQHEHQSLLYPSKHLEILDRFAGEEIVCIKTELKEQYKQYIQFKEELESQSMDTEARLRQVDFLEYEIQEIQQAKLQPGEEEELERQYRRMNNSKDIVEGLNEAYEALSDHSVNGAGNQISRGVRALSTIAGLDDGLTSLGDQLNTIESLVSDFNREVSEYINQLTFDQSAFYEVEQRLDVIRSLTVKYGGSVERVMEQLEEKQAQYDKLKNYEQYLGRLESDYQEAKAKVLNTCGRLSQARKKSSDSLVKQIKEALVDLNFLEVEFLMDFQQKEEPTANGYDEVGFLITTNPGMPPRPLKEVASGGELSRIMLAIKSVLADVDKVETLIFDEIDTGISGRTAQKVSEKLNVISRHHQVICITHLAQIAAMADYHYLIEKKLQNGITNTSIIPLSEEDSILELARITGGVSITETVIENAREMKQLATRAKLD